MNPTHTVDQGISPRRLGTFRIPLETFERELETIFKALAPRVMAVRCESRYDTHSLHFTAISPYFDEVEGFCEPPRYEVLLEHKADGTSHFLGFYKHPETPITLTL